MELPLRQKHYRQQNILTKLCPIIETEFQIFQINLKNADTEIRVFQMNFCIRNS